MRARVGLGVQRISIHALHEESDLRMVGKSATMLQQFQSTLSMRRATGRDKRVELALSDFNPRSP